MKKFGVALIGLIFTAVGVFMYFQNDSFSKNCTVEAEATVVDMKREFSTDIDTAGTSYIYYPIIEYKINDTAVLATMRTGSSMPAYNFGDTITILYNPNNTQEFIIKGDVSSNIMSYVMIGLGVLITGYGIFVIVKKEQ